MKSSCNLLIRSSISNHEESLQGVCSAAWSIRCWQNQWWRLRRWGRWGPQGTGAKGPWPQGSAQPVLDQTVQGGHLRGQNIQLSIFCPGKKIILDMQEKF